MTIDMSEPPVARPKLYIATPAYGCTITNSYLVSLLFLRNECAKRGIQCLVDFLGNESLITRARNLLVEQFLKTDSTHLLFIDADISFNAESVFAMLEANKDVICSIYPKKNYVWDKLKDTNVNPNEPIFQKALDFNINILRDTPVEGGRFCRVLDAATGFMMIKREVLLKMKEAFTSLTCVNDVTGYDIKEYVALFDCMIDPQTRRYLSEDYAFCRRWQLIGGEIWADIKSMLGHEGNFYFRDGVIPVAAAQQQPVVA